MRRLREVFPNELVVIGVHSAKFPTEQLTENIRAAVLRHGITHPVLNDAGFQVWSEYAVRAWPTLVLIDPAGKIIGNQSGEILADDFIPMLAAMAEEWDQAGLLDRTPLDLKPELANEPEQLLSFPSRVLLEADGRLFVADTGHHRVLEMKLDPDGQSAEILRQFGSGEAGFQDGRLNEAQFHHPHGLALLRDTLYVADTDNHAIRAVRLHEGRVDTVAGTGIKGIGKSDTVEARETALRSPWAIVAFDDQDSNIDSLLFIAMAGSHQIWVLLNEQRLGILAGNGQEALVDGAPAEASFNQPSDLAFGYGHLLVADAEASAIRALSLGENARVKTLVGQGLFEFGDVDGVGAEVRLQHPAGISFSQKQIYIADSYNHKIKVLEPVTGRTESLIGTGRVGDRDGTFSESELNQPEGLWADEQRIFIADTNNHRIRVADLTQQQLKTLRIRGLERLASAGTKHTTKEPNRLPEALVSPGETTIELNLTLPKGYSLNPEAPVVVRMTNSGHPHDYQFSAGEPVRLHLDIAEPQDALLELTIYYCQTEDERLCLIHTESLLLPLLVQVGAPNTAPVQIDIPDYKR